MIQSVISSRDQHTAQSRNQDDGDNNQDNKADPFELPGSPGAPNCPLLMLDTTLNVSLGLGDVVVDLGDLVVLLGDQSLHVLEQLCELGHALLDLPHGLVTHLDLAQSSTGLATAIRVEQSLSEHLLVRVQRLVDLSVGRLGLDDAVLPSLDVSVLVLRSGLDPAKFGNQVGELPLEVLSLAPFRGVVLALVQESLDALLQRIPKATSLHLELFYLVFNLVLALHVRQSQTTLVQSLDAVDVVLILHQVVLDVLNFVVERHLRRSAAHFVTFVGIIAHELPVE